MKTGEQIIEELVQAIEALKEAAQRVQEANAAALAWLAIEQVKH